MAEEFKPQYTFTDDRLNKLKQLFPEAWEDGVFNVDTLKTLIGEYSTDNNIKEHFGLNWVGKQDARKIAAKPPTGTLKPCPGEGVNEDNTENIFIEGENLEVLKILRKSYMGKIKMIYIDPPYNTGNDFIYNDTFADSTEDYLRKTGDKSDEGLLVSNPKSSGKYHANWLSFMYPRLRLAKDLLKEDGVIFISIGPDEFANLNLQCDEIFGEENLAGICVRQAKSGGNNGVFFSPNVEYILVYCKNISVTKGFKAELSSELIKKVYTSVQESGERKGEYYRTMGLFQAGLKDLRPNQKFFIECPDGSKVLPPCGIQDETMRIGDGRWRWTKPKYLKELENGNVEFKETTSSPLVNANGEPSKWNIYTKIWLKDRQEEGQVPNDLILKFENRHSSKELKLLDIPFDFAKPTGLIKYLISFIDMEDGDIILDFFAGSGSTAHAVLDFIESKKKRVQFINVQLNEKVNNKDLAFKKGFKTISEVTQERIKRAINLINKNQGFKVFKQSKSTIYKWQDFIPQQDGIIPDLFSKLELAFKNPLLDGTDPQDFITEIILQEGFPLTAKKEEAISGVFKITHEWVPYNLYVSMLQSFKNIDLNQLQLKESDHFICLDKAFESNDALKQAIDNQCKLFTI